MTKILISMLVFLPLFLNAEEGFTTLSEGTIDKHWMKSDYNLKDGIISGKKGRLLSKEEYSDFHLKFDFKLPPGGNNGLAIRSPLKGRPIELQILDSEHPKYANLKDYQYHGSLYNYAPAKRGHLKPAGEWNSQEVICKGLMIEVILNGTTILNVDLSKVKPLGDRYIVPYINKATKGHIGFLSHGAIVQFKNVRIKNL